LADIKALYHARPDGLSGHGRTPQRAGMTWPWKGPREAAHNTRRTMPPANRLTVLLASYGRFHRDPRNRLTHYFGVPAIIYSVLVPMALSVHWLFGLPVRLDRIVVAAAAVGYIWLDIGLGLALTAILTLLASTAEATLAMGSPLALGTAAVAFVLGWTLQLLGHRLEGNRPALLTNLAQILVAPLYLVAELEFALGWRPSLREHVERRLG
jgi:uncharacterized membrane protein YGL010W